MKLKITGRNKEQFKSNLDRFINLASLITLKGYVPNTEDMNSPEQFGNWWYEDEHSRYQLNGANNDWLNISTTCDISQTVEFNFRYDTVNKKKITISNLMLAFFDFVEKI